MTALPAVYTLILTRLCISMLDTRIPGWRLPCIGREIADPFYSQHPARFAPWQHARRVALFPHPFSALGWVDKKHIVNATSGQLSNNQSSVLTSIGLKHFVACECDNHACCLAAKPHRVSATDTLVVLLITRMQVPLPR